MKSKWQSRRGDIGSVMVKCPHTACTSTSTTGDQVVMMAASAWWHRDQRHCCSYTGGCCHYCQLSLSLSLCHSTRGRSRDKKSSIFTRWQKCCYWADLPAWFCPVIGPRGSGGPQDGLPLAGRVTWLGPVAVLGWDFLWKVWKSGSSAELSWSRPWRRGQARAHCAPVHLCGPIIGTLFPTQCKLV